MKLEARISFSYGSHEVLRDVEIEAEKGELVAIIGPNGAGKSTLLKCMVGILKASGYVRLNGRDLLKMKPGERAKLITYVPQSSLPEFAFTIEEFVEMGTYKTRGDVEGALKKVGLWERKGEPVTNLSGGEYQLALIARALAQGSDVILLDEPTSHLDINHALKIMELLRELREDKIVIAVLHDLNLALRYSDRIILLHRGQKRWEGEPEKLSPAVLEEVYGVRAEILDVKGELTLIASL